jgi:hypothetical protein
VNFGLKLGVQLYAETIISPGLEGIFINNRYLAKMSASPNINMPLSKKLL